MNTNIFMQKDPTVKLPLAVQAYLQYGIPKSVVAHAITKYFSISQDIQYTCLDTYFTRVWTGQVFISKSQGGVIYDTESDTAYHIIYANGIKRYDIECAPGRNLFLSFRAAKPLYNLPAYVIVKWKGYVGGESDSSERWVSKTCERQLGTQDIPNIPNIPNIQSILYASSADIETSTHWG